MVWHFFSTPPLDKPFFLSYNSVVQHLVLSTRAVEFLDKGGYDASDQESKACSKESRSKETRSEESLRQETLRQESCRGKENHSKEARSQKSSGEKGEVNQPLQYCYSGRTFVRLFFVRASSSSASKALTKNDLYCLISLLNIGGRCGKSQVVRKAGETDREENHEEPSCQGTDEGRYEEIPSSP